MEQFYCKTKIYFGAGAVAALKNMQIQRLFLICDPYFEKNGEARSIIQEAEAVENEVFSQVVPDPTVESVAKGTLQLRRFQPDAVVALGGGSAMDCGKAMLYFSGIQIPMIAIPTTSGSGSEVTDFAILTHNGVKHPLIDPSLRPEVAIIDSDLVTTLPPTLVAEGGFDLISHALEAFVATDASTLSDLFALKAFDTANENLYGSFCGDMSMRAKMHLAATMAGISFSQSGLGLCHAISHSLGGEFHIPHGRLNAILLPSVIERNATVSCHRYAQLVRYTGLSSGSDTMALRALKNVLLRLRRNLQLPSTLAQAGVDPVLVADKMDKLVAAALSDPCCHSNPLPPTDAIVRSIITEVIGRE